MTRARRKPKQKGAAVVLDSDDEATYRKEAVPNSRDDDFYLDDIDQFHVGRDKILLDKSATLGPVEESSEEEEVYAVGNYDDEDEEILEYKQRLRMMNSQAFKDSHASDLEDEHQGLPSDKAWGKTKKKYYGADISDEDRGDSESEDEAAELEEQEARAIQKRLATQLQDQHLGLDLFQPAEKPEKTQEGKSDRQIVKDLSKMSRKEKMKLLKKESPELLGLIEEYRAKMTVVKDRLLPLHELIQQGALPPSTGADFVEAQLRLYNSYCINISYYLVLKSQHKPVQDHPVIQRILQFRQLINQLNTAEEKVKPLIDDLLVKVKAGKDLKVKATDNTSLISKIREQREKQEKCKKLQQEKRKKLDKLSHLADEDESEDEDMLPTGGGGGRRKRKEVDGIEEESKSKKSKAANGEEDLGTPADDGSGEDIFDEDTEQDGEEKRGITYEMAKNKGLTARKKKIDRNPRVKHRMKFRKAKIRRRGQVREVRKETTKYGGEIYGIKAGVKRSVKLK